MQLADAYKDLQIENAELKIELRDLRFEVGKYEDAIEEALDDYASYGPTERMGVILREALGKP